MTHVEEDLRRVLSDRLGAARPPGPIPRATLRRATAARLAALGAATVGALATASLAWWGAAALGGTAPPRDSAPAAIGTPDARGWQPRGRPVLQTVAEGDDGRVVVETLVTWRDEARGGASECEVTVRDAHGNVLATVAERISGPTAADAAAHPPPYDRELRVGVPVAEPSEVVAADVSCALEAGRTD
ncbi:MAG TPA: hypothetical protein VHJ34_06525 [Actinomycetota bacterium]|nr:hypothetical protein [Actinomycetota bacterium]